MKLLDDIYDEDNKNSYVLIPILYSLEFSHEDVELGQRVCWRVFVLTIKKFVEISLKIFSEEQKIIKNAHF